MRILQKLGNALLWVLLIFVICIPILYASTQRDRHEELIPSVVKVLPASGGHGTGFHIGDGRILTNAHVAGKDQTAKVKTMSGDVVDADILWTAKSYDIAMLKLKEPLDMEVDTIACRDLIVGEKIRTIGNPGGYEFHSFYGQVSSITQKRGRWLYLTGVDMTIAPGMSGGPVYGSKGKVVGIASGTSTFMRLGGVVPGFAICDVLGKSY